MTRICGNRIIRVVAVSTVVMHWSEHIMRPQTVFSPDSSITYMDGFRDLSYFSPSVARLGRSKLSSECDASVECDRDIHIADLGRKNMRSLYLRARSRLLYRRSSDHADQLENMLSGEDYETYVLQVIRVCGSLNMAGLIAFVAEKMLRDEQICGANATDIAIWGPIIFRREASAMVRQMIGHTFLLEAEGPWLLMVPAAEPLVAASPRHNVNSLCV